MRRSFVAAVVLIASLASLYAQGVAEPQDQPDIVASTSWVAAMAEAAGATNVALLAPVELKHPPEYDFKPSDIIKAANARLLLWAGYEGFMKELFSATGAPDEKIVKVSTNNSPDLLVEAVRALARVLGTEQQELAWEIGLDEFSRRTLASAAEKQVPRLRAAVQFHHQALARWLGYEVVAVFGPNEMTISQLQLITQLNVDLVIDNWHSPLGLALKDQEPSYVQLINFPGQGGTKTLLDVLHYNMRQLGLE